MKTLEQYLESGILDLFVAGSLSENEEIEIAKAASLNPELQAAIEAMRESYALLVNAISRPAPARSKSRFLNAIDALEKEAAAFDPMRPPVLNSNSKPSDYDFWVNLDIASNPKDLENLFFVPVADNEDGLTAVVWIKGNVEEEEHLDSIEKFLVLEGACMIDIEGDVHHLKAGDQLSIPKYKSHTVQVTSDIVCKLIVQRIAA